MSSAASLQFSKSMIVSRWPFWFYSRCQRCTGIQRVGVGYTAGPDVCTFDPVEQCHYHHRLLDAHAGAVGRGRNTWHVKKCDHCKKIHGDWSYLTDHEWVQASLAAKDGGKVTGKPTSHQAEVRKLSKSLYAMQEVVKEEKVEK